MDYSVYWFAALASLGMLGLSGGMWLGRTHPRMARMTMGVSVFMLIAWAWLFHYPSVAVEIIPAVAQNYLEGTAGVPVCLLVLGIAYARSTRAPQRRACGLAMLFAMLYFVNGGMWMLQATPRVGFAGNGEGRIVYQSHEFSCVPAACATALNLIDIPTTETEMAQLTQTRPGTGATLIRARNGLAKRLENTAYEPVLLQPDSEALKHLPSPFLTPIRVDSTRRYLHMVVVVNCSGHHVIVIDPTEGPHTMAWDKFAEKYTGQVVVFDKRR